MANRFQNVVLVREAALNVDYMSGSFRTAVTFFSYARMKRWRPDPNQSTSHRITTSLRLFVYRVIQARAGGTQVYYLILPARLDMQRMSRYQLFNRIGFFHLRVEKVNWRNARRHPYHARAAAAIVGSDGLKKRKELMQQQRGNSHHHRRFVEH